MDPAHKPIVYAVEGDWYAWCVCNQLLGPFGNQSDTWAVLAVQSEKCRRHGPDVAHPIERDATRTQPRRRSAG